jgi:hypothetical protein
LRPRVAKGTPKCFIDLASRCLDAIPQNRPSSKKLHKKMNNLLKDYDHSEFFKIDKLDKETTSSPTEPNPKANIY